MIIDTFKRDRLSEGRDSGLGYAILKKADDDNYHSLTGFSACKDYFNDFIFVENTKYNLDKIYGFQHEYTGLLENNPKYIHVAITPAVVGYSGKKNDKYHKIKPSILNCDNLIRSVRLYEDIFAIKNKISLAEIITHTDEISQEEEVVVILAVSSEWTVNHYAFSLILLLIRCLLGVQNIEDTFKNNITLIQEDSYFYNPSSFLNIPKHILFSPYMNVSTLSIDSGDVHNKGIKYFCSNFNDKFLLEGGTTEIKTNDEEEDE